MAAHDTGLHGDGLGVGADFVIEPTARGNNQHRIGYGLSRQACATGAESDGNLVSGGSLEQLDHFFLVGRNDNYFRYEPIKSGIRAPCEGAQLVGVDAVAGHELQYFFKIGVMLGRICGHLSNDWV